jgi:hypothetical protein
MAGQRDDARRDQQTGSSDSGTSAGSASPAADVNSIVARSGGDPNALASFVKAHPAARDAVMTVLQQTLGNAAVRGVISMLTAPSAGPAAPAAAPREHAAPAQQPAPQPTMTPAPTTPASATQPLHRLGPDVPVTATTDAEETPAARTATWEQIQAAATSDEGKVALDIKWIDDLPAHMRNEIDTDFYSDAKAQQYTTAATGPDLKALDAKLATDLKSLHDEVAKRLAGSDDKHKIAAVSQKDIEHDADYGTRHDELVKDY